MINSDEKKLQTTTIRTHSSSSRVTRIAPTREDWDVRGTIYIITIHQTKMIVQRQITAKLLNCFACDLASPMRINTSQKTVTLPNITSLNFR
jgi:hypothetical protein